MNIVSTYQVLSVSLCVSFDGFLNQGVLSLQNHNCRFVLLKLLFVIGLHRFLVEKQDSVDVKTFFWSSPISGVHERIHKLYKGTDEQKVWESLC